MTAPTLELRGITQRFGGRVALDDVSLTVSGGSVVGLLGPNGAGKTTLISVVAGLTKPTAGEVWWRGERLPYPFPKAMRRDIGLLPQTNALYDELSVRQNLRFAAELYGVSDLDDRVAEVVALVGLDDRIKDRVNTLSGGMQRRVAIARALIHDPALLVLDEPSLGVDVEARHAIWSYVRRLRSTNKTVILTTNYLDEAEALCDRVVVLREGTAIADGDPAELLARTGRCVELDCGADDVESMRAAVGDLEGVQRITATDLGLTVYLEPAASPDAVAGAALQTGHVQGFRVRAPDLVEVFHALTDRAG
jgi:ABC-2 type transport system ATP-binding protein